MPQLCDLSHLFGQDIVQAPNGDIAVVSGALRTQQRIIRRLCTAQTTLQQCAYPWRPTYGAGLGQKVGSNFDARGITAIVMSQILLEPSVARLPMPSVKARQNAGSGVITIDINYTDTSGVQQSFGFSLSQLPPGYVGDPSGGYVGDPSGGYVGDPSP